MLMIEIRHDFNYKNPNNPGSAVNIGPGRIYIISRATVEFLHKAKKGSQLTSTLNLPYTNPIPTNSSYWSCDLTLRVQSIQIWSIYGFSIGNRSNGFGHMLHIVIPSP